MQSVQLEKIEIEGFKSYSKPATINLSINPGLKFIGGSNLVNARLGANGAGKSSTWDAVHWCLFNESVRGKKTSDLVNRDCKTATVTTSWSIHGTRYEIKRSGPPSKIWINGNVAEQKEIELVLKVSKDRFLQSVLFGQASPLFYDLSIPDRGALLDEVLDLGVWLKLSDYARDKVSDLERQINDCNLQLERLRGKLDGLSNVDELRSLETKWEKEFEAELEQTILQIEEAEGEAETQRRVLQTAIQNLTKLPQPQSFSDQIRKLDREIANLESEGKRYHEKIQAATKTLDFYQNNQKCPTCLQHISSLTRESKTGLAKSEINLCRGDIQINSGKINRISKQIEAVREEHSKLQRKIQHFTTIKSEAETVIKSIELSIVVLSDYVEQKFESKQNPWTSQIVTQETERKKITAKLNELDTFVKTLEGSKLLIEYWKQGFKKVRLFLVKRTLTFLELEANNAANTLGLQGWYIKFSTEIETKSGSMKPGIHISVTSGNEKQSGEWSPGEAQRIRLSVSLGLSNIIQKAAGSFFKLCIFDEPTNWLSSEGIEDLLLSLKYYAELNQKSVWLIDHRALTFSGFSEYWNVTKTAEGSMISQVMS